MQLPIGFRAGSTQAGIKPSGKPDLALLVSGTPCNWGYVATLNRAAAPSVTRGRQLYAAGGPLQALVVNAGNANCATGDLGVQTDLQMAQLASQQLGLAPELVLTGSTGVIGQPLPIAKVQAGLPGIRLGLEVDPFMQAILTTDLVPKMAEETLSGGARIVGICKGSGMIQPNMATMLAYIVSDAKVSQEEIRQRWPGVMDRSFNQVTVDTDTSTNDMAVLMCNGAAGAVDSQEFWAAIERVCVSLARQLARDGEGATKLLTIKVSQAASDAEARKAALTIAASPLWKSAVYGNDPNWGRVMMALGKSGAQFDTRKVRISLQGIALYAGRVLDFDRDAASQAMKAEEVIVDVELGEGTGQGSAWGCDLTEEYVKINALYTT